MSSVFELKVCVKIHFDKCDREAAPAKFSPHTGTCSSSTQAIVDSGNSIAAVAPYNFFPPGSLVAARKGLKLRSVNGV